MICASQYPDWLMSSLPPKAGPTVFKAKPCRRDLKAMYVSKVFCAGCCPVKPAARAAALIISLNAKRRQKRKYVSNRLAHWMMLQPLLVTCSGLPATGGWRVFHVIESSVKTYGPARSTSR